MSTGNGIYGFFRSKAGHATFAAVLLSTATAVIVPSFSSVGQLPAHSDGTRGKMESRQDDAPAPGARRPPVDAETTIVQLDAKKIETIGVMVEPVCRAEWPRQVKVTGRLELNESKVAHVSALVAGVVREICVEMGEDVQAGKVLAYIYSREAGEAKLRMTQNQLALKSAQQTYDWYDAIHSNTHDLLAALQKGNGVDEIEKQFRNRPIGSYRQQLVSALADAKHATADYERIRELGEESVVPEKEVIHARAHYESSSATYQALLEQIRFDSDRQLLVSQQKVKEAETALAVSRSQLFILGFSAEDIATMDPIAEGERVAYYPVRAPFAGTVIARDAVLSKHVDAECELVEIADLSTVWLRADIFEKDLGAVHGLDGKLVEFRTTSYPDQVFSAKVFSLGNVVNDQTRAASLLAVVENSDRQLKPGMFAEIDLFSGYDTDVALVPASAIQRHDGASFVFVRRGPQKFERRDVRIGRSTSENVEILGGLAEDESVVVRGCFALKSEMLSELMVEE